LFLFWNVAAQPIKFSGSLIVPNASFVYVLFALLWTMLWTRSDLADGNRKKEAATKGALMAPMPPPKMPPPANSDQNNASVDGNPASVVGTASMQIDVSNFAGTKLKTRGYLQAGKDGRYPGTAGADTRIASLTDVDTDLVDSIKDLRSFIGKCISFDFDHT
jgi:hypothetical protein